MSILGKEEMKKELVEIGRRIAKEKLVVGSGGNISLRFGDYLYIKASGVFFDDATLDDYVCVDMKTGEVIEGNKKPSSEIFMHIECLKARDDINAVVHTHPNYSIAYASQDESLKPFTPDMVLLLGTEIPVIKFFLPGSMEFAREVARIIKSHNGVLIRNHGLVTVGKDLKEAFERTLLIEHSIKTIFISKFFGKLEFFDQNQIESIKNKYKK